MAITLRDIAARAKVHPTTVSKVLNGTYRQFRITDDRAESVRRVAEEMGYRPNLSARAVRSGRFDCIAMISGTDGWRSPMPARMLGAIEADLDAAGMTLMLSQVVESRLDSGDYVPSILKQGAYDGLLINYQVTPPPQFISMVRKRAIPSVWINADRRADTVRPDDRAAARQVTRQLLAAGHRDVVYVDESIEQSRRAGTLHYSKLHRLEGYRQAMADAGLPPRALLDSDTAERVRMSDVLRHGVAALRPTAAVTYGGWEARLLELVARQAGLSVPDDLSIVTFVDAPEEPDELRFSGMVIPAGKVGAESVKLLRLKIDGGDEPHPPVLLPMTYLPGFSTPPGMAAPAT